MSYPKVLIVVSSLAAVIALLGCGSSDRPHHFSDAPFPNVDAANTRRATGSITSRNVDELGFAWSVPIAPHEDEFGSYVATPVVSGGIAYSQDQASTVEAIDLEDGDVLWETRLGSAGYGHNGVVLGRNRVFAVNKTNVVSLDERTGQKLWSVRLADRGERLDMAPGYNDGFIYVSTVPWALKGGEVGTIWAMDAKTGRKVWKFHTVPPTLWGNPKLNYGGGTSYTPAFDGGSSMYVGIGNAGPIPGTARQPWGQSRPGRNLYSDSVVKLDDRTGKLRWYYQVTPHGLCNWNVISPVLLRVRGRQIVLATGLAGRVMALDARTGSPIWQRSVGIHNGHDRDGLIALKGEYSRLKTPMTVYPGRLGGVFSAVSVGGSTVILSVVNLATRLSTQVEAEQAGSFTGELVALNAATGALEWSHRFNSPPVGPTTVVNDLVFGTTFGGSAFAIDVASGKKRWSTPLPAKAVSGLAISGDTLLVPAGYAKPEHGPEILAYRLSGEG